MKKFHLAIFASGSGSNAESIVTYFKGHQAIRVELILSNNPHAYVLERARRLGVPSQVFNKDQFKSGEELLWWLKQKSVTHIVLAGFLWMIPSYLISQFPNRIINIHPALLPKFGGKGMYGMHVHEAVKKSRERESGITIHLVNEHYDEGKILFQKSCDISMATSATEIAACVQELEHEHYPRTIEKWLQGD